VNRLAQVAAVAALEDPEHMRHCVQRTIEERERMREALAAMDFASAHCVANFVFFDAREDSSRLAEKLLPHGVIVKPWREPGYQQHVRVSIGSPRSDEMFLAALEKERGKDS
jgi:histidinol-phosphate aminotransferase